MFSSNWIPGLHLTEFSTNIASFNEILKKQLVNFGIKSALRAFMLQHLIWNVNNCESAYVAGVEISTE